jgi:hypothetical protein
MYIRLFIGDAISGPSMYAYSGSSKGLRNGETVISANVRKGLVAACHVAAQSGGSAADPGVR